MKSITASQIEPSMTQKSEKLRIGFAIFATKFVLFLKGSRTRETKLVVQLAGLCVNHGSVMAVVGVR